MSLILDENLSPRLVPRLSELFGALTHVREVGLAQAPDDAIWKWAKANNSVIVSTDSDFVELSERLGWPPKVIHLEECDFPFRVIEDLLRQNAIRIAEFERASTVGLLRIRLQR